MLSIRTITNFYNNCKSKYSHQTIDEFNKLYELIKKKGALSENETTDKIIVIDLTSQKPKYGELIHTFQTCIVLKMLKLNPKVYIFLPGENLKGQFFKNLVNEDKVMLNVLKDAKKLATILLDEFDIKHKVVFDRKFQKYILDNKSSSIIFGDLVKKMYDTRNWTDMKALDSNFFKLNQEILSLLFVQYQDRLIKSGKKWLIGDILRSKYPSKEQDRYLATNFRYNPARSAKDSNASQTIEWADYFWKKYSYKTLVVTCDQGHDFLINQQGYTEDSIIFGKPGSFIEESKFAVNAKFFYQVQGGGIGVWALFSRDIPYIFLCDPMCLVCFDEMNLYPIAKSEYQEYYATWNKENISTFPKKAQKYAKKCLKSSQERLK